MAAQQRSLEELMARTAERDEHYPDSLGSLHEGGHVLRSRERSDTQVTINEAYLAPARVHSGPVFSADVGGAYNHHTIPVPGPRGRRSSTLEAPERPSSIYPSPITRPLPLTPNPNSGEFSLHDEDLSFIPLLDTNGRQQQQQQQSNNKRSSTPTDNTPRTTKPLKRLSFTDDMLLRHLRDSEFWGETARLLEEVLSQRRRGDIDLAVPFRDFASYEREGYLSATFELYDIAADATVRKTSADVDVQGLVKYAGDGGPFESQDEIVDAPMVWDSIKDVNPEGHSVGRIMSVTAFLIYDEAHFLLTLMVAESYRSRRR